MNDVRRQLVVDERNGRILKWHDRMIPPGTDWRARIDSRVEQAQIILLFMSPHFIDSRYCYEVEGGVALRRLQANEARVIPIILRACPWQRTVFGHLQALPTGARPIKTWPDLDEASLDAARGVMEVVDELVLQDAPAFPITVSAARVELTYCARCGHKAGERTVCTGAYTQHEFVRGVASDYCSRCGCCPGVASHCTGAYTHHAFTKNPSNSVHCSRCGTHPRERTICTGAYTQHEFVGG